MHGAALSAGRFCSPTKGNHDRVRIAEHATNGRGGDETWEGVEVAESGVEWHHEIVTDFVRTEKTKTALKNKVS